MHDEILSLVEKPVRYIGGEWNQIVKPPRPGLARIGLAFPDTYEIGMSHLGMRLLYDLLNREEDLAAERVFCPWTDMETALRRHHLPLGTLESRTPLAALDVLGFSLQFEMEYSNVLTMLDLGGIPLHSAARSREHPLVIAGGPCVFSPEPMADFIDAFVIGDGEEAFPAVVRRWKELQQAPGTRESMLAALAELPGVYVPSLYQTQVEAETGFEIVAGPRPGCDVPFPVKRAVVESLEPYPFPSDTLVPYGEIVHDRVAIEIARGCTEGCRFCQAGIIYRPVRERTPADIIRAASRGLKRTGYDEVSLTSLSTADYSCVTSLVKTLVDRYVEDRTALSLSSMRVYGLTRSIAEQLARVRRTGFTIAPEAGTQRMRDLINKGITDADIDMAADIAWEQRWGNLKLYFMIGLPTETDDDVRGIAETGIRVYELARRRGHRRAQVTVSVSGLVPKPHSTFQWEAMDSSESIRRKQRLILETLRPHRNVRFKYHDTLEGVVECILSRGDRRLGAVIEMAWRRGARFDSWSDHFDYSLWMDCLRQAGLEPDLFLRRIPPHAPLPWDHIDSLVKKQFLLRDLHAGMKGRFLPACEKPFIPRDPKKTVKPLEHANLVCYHCGLDCDLDAIKQERIAQRDSLSPPGPEIAAAFRGEPPLAPATAPPAATHPAREQPAAMRPLATRSSAPRGDVTLRLPGSAPGSAASEALATNAFEATQGMFHGEPALGPPAGESVAGPAKPHSRTARAGGVPAEAARRLHYRVWFSKRGTLRWLSHLDLLRAMQRACRRAALPVTYSQGFHPAPLMSFGPALAVGLEGAAELFDFESSHDLQPDEIVGSLNASLPQGLRILRAARLAEGAPSLSKCIDLGIYRAWVNEDWQRLDPGLFETMEALPFRKVAWQQERIAAFMHRHEFVVTRAARGAKGTGKPEKSIDIRPFVRELRFEPSEPSLLLALRLGSQGQARPQEVVRALYELPGECFRYCRESLGSESELLPHLMEPVHP